MNELSDVRVHRWLSTCRALMVWEPWQGCTRALICLGRFSPYSLGWTRSETGLAGQDAVKFIYVGPEGGQTVVGKPPDNVPIAQEKFPHPNELDLLWRLHCDIGDKVIALRLDEPDPEQVQEVRQRIDSYRKYNPADHRARDAALRARLLAARPDLLRLWNHAFPTVQDVGGYLLCLVDHYLSFRVPGSVAAELLGLLIAMIADVPRFTNFRMDAECTRASVMHLADLAYGVLQRRDRYSLSGYFTLTYLAGLYASAARSIAARARDGQELQDDQLNKIMLMGNNADELFAHHVGPAFTLPALFDPRDLLLFLQSFGARGKMTQEEAAAHFSIPPAFRSLLDRVLTLDDAQIVEELREAESALDHLDVETFIRHDAHPLPQTVADRI